MKDNGYKCNVGPSEGDHQGDLPVNPAMTLREGPIKVTQYDNKPASRPMSEAPKTHVLHADEGKTPVTPVTEYYQKG